MNNQSSTNALTDGDFASCVESMQNSAERASPLRTEISESADHLTDRREQRIEDVVFHGAEPTSEFIEEWNAIQNAPELSDEGLARQALSAPGDDGDPNTPNEGSWRSLGRRCAFC